LSWQNVVPILSLCTKSYLSSTTLLFPQTLAVFFVAFLTPLFEAKRRLHSGILTTRFLHQNIITVPGSHICTVGSKKRSGKAKDLTL
jgi:hypothetical protein